MHRNWHKISQLEDAQLMMLIATTTHASTLEGLRRGFPELFIKEALVFDGEWPRAVIIKVMSEWDMEIHDPPDDFLRKRLGLPIVSICEPSVEFEHGILVTREELRELQASLPDPTAEFYTFRMLPPIVTLRDGRQFYALQATDEDIIALPVECVC